MVSLYISVRRAHAKPNRLWQKKYVVLQCLRALGNVGYNIPSFSSMMIKALDEGCQTWCGRSLCNGYSTQAIWCGKIEVNLIAHTYIYWYVYIFQHLQVEEYDLTFAACSFETILNQAMPQLGPYEWEFGRPTPTTHGFQERVLVTNLSASPWT